MTKPHINAFCIFDKNFLTAQNLGDCPPHPSHDAAGDGNPCLTGHAEILTALCVTLLLSIIFFMHVLTLYCVILYCQCHLLWLFWKINTMRAGAERGASQVVETSRPQFDAASRSRRVGMTMKHSRDRQTDAIASIDNVRL